MGTLDSYKVVLRDMPSDTVSYQWHVNDDFFSAVEGPEIQQGSLDVALRVKRTSATYELEFSFEGMVKVPCDRCLGLMDQPIAAQHTLRVRLGSEFEDDGETITVHEQDGELNVAWNLYELIALEIPMRHVHPEGECSVSLPHSEDDTAAETIDPRWDALRKLVNNK